MRRRMFESNRYLTTPLAFLDMEKVIEHRQPLDKTVSQRRQASPQRKLCYSFQLNFFNPRL